MKTNIFTSAATPAVKQISYVSPTVELFVETMTKAGVPEQFVGMFAGFSEAIRQGEFETFKTDLENLLGRKPISVRQFLEEVYGSKKISKSGLSKNSGNLKVDRYLLSE